MKLNKDKILSIRINSEVFEDAKKKGITPQSVLDDWVDKNYRIKIERKESAKLKAAIKKIKDTDQ